MRQKLSAVYPIVFHGHPDNGRTNALADLLREVAGHIEFQGVTVHNFSGLVIECDLDTPQFTARLYVWENEHDER